MSGRRNAVVMGLTAMALSGLMTFPTSRGVGHTGTATTTPAGVVAINGTAVQTRFGPVQVQVTVTAGKVTAAKAIAYPTQGRRDQEINAYAIPVLEQEAVSAQSAQIDTVSGATYTSQGYVASLQAALDAAHL